MTSKETDNFKKDAGGIQEPVQEEEGASFSKKVIQESQSPHNLGRIIEPDGFAMITGSCGDTIELYLKVKNGRIDHISFMTDGCEPSIASGSMATILARGKTLDEAMNITSSDISKALGGLPEENFHCAELAADALHSGINDYLETAYHEPEDK